MILIKLHKILAEVPEYLQKDTNLILLLLIHLKALCYVFKNKKILKGKSKFW